MLKKRFANYFNELFANMSRSIFITKKFINSCCSDNWFLSKAIYALSSSDIKIDYESLLKMILQKGNYTTAAWIINSCAIGDLSISNYRLVANSLFVEKCCKYGFLVSLKIIQKYGFYIHWWTRKSGFLLACEFNHLNIVKFMYELGINKSEDGFIIACKNGNIEIAEFLFNKNPNYDLRNVFFDSLKKHNIEMIEWISLKSDINTIVTHREMAHFAKHGLLYLVKLLATLGYDIETFKDSFVEHIVKHKQYRILKWMKQFKPNMQTIFITYCAYENNLELTKFICQEFKNELNKKGEIDNIITDGLVVAAKLDLIDFIKLVCSFGTKNISFDKVSAKSCKYNNDEISKYISDNFINFYNLDLSQIIHNDKLFEWIYNYFYYFFIKYNKNTDDYYKNICACYAAEYGKIEILDIIIRRGKKYLCKNSIYNSIIRSTITDEFMKTDLLMWVEMTIGFPDRSFLIKQLINVYYPKKYNYIIKWILQRHYYSCVTFLQHITKKKDLETIKWLFETFPKLKTSDKVLDVFNDACEQNSIEIAEFLYNNSEPIKYMFKQQYGEDADEIAIIFIKYKDHFDKYNESKTKEDLMREFCTNGFNELIIFILNRTDMYDSIIDELFEIAYSNSHHDLARWIAINKNSKHFLAKAFKKIDKINTN